MPLPEADQAASQPWPPHDPALADIAEWSAWYGGDTRDLKKLASNVYGGQRPGRTPAGSRLRFWARRATDDDGQARSQLHVPLPADIASSSADLLFGEPPGLEIREANETDAADAAQAQDRLDQLDEQLGLHAVWLEAAEICAALGGVYLVPSWNREVADEPLMTVQHPDVAVPEWRSGRLVAVTFWSVVARNDTTVWRHLERHERGVIFHGLYQGAPDRLGVKRPLDAHPDTADLRDEVRLGADVPALGKSLLPVYVPNVRPNRRRRHSPQGRSDLQGAEPIFDALDEAYSSWMNDIRLGRRRIIVAESALQRTGRGQGAVFDTDRDVFTTLNVLQSGAEGEKPLVESIDFTIRSEDHERTCMNLIERAISNAGYSPQTFGLHIEGRAESGTALHMRERKTWFTRLRKQGYWTGAMGEVTSSLLAIDAALFGGVAGEWRIAINWGDALPDQPKELAETISLFRAAKAMSVDTAVRMAQPHLNDDEVAAEVARIVDEDTLAVPDPLELGLDQDEGDDDRDDVE